MIMKRDTKLFDSILIDLSNCSFLIKLCNQFELSFFSRKSAKNQNILINFQDVPVFLKPWKLKMVNILDSCSCLI
jgi:hypothetical protein